MIFNECIQSPAGSPINRDLKSGYSAPYWCISEYLVVYPERSEDFSYFTEQVQEVELGSFMPEAGLFFYICFLNEILKEYQQFSVRTQQTRWTQIWNMLIRQSGISRIDCVERNIQITGKSRWSFSDFSAVLKFCDFLSTESNRYIHFRTPSQSSFCV